MSPLQVLGTESTKGKDPISSRNLQRRIQVYVAMITNIIITLQGILAVWSPSLREGMLGVWPILSTIYAFATGVIMTYLIVGSSENKHSAELSLIKDDPRLRAGFHSNAKTVKPVGPRDQVDRTPE